MRGGGIVEGRQCAVPTGARAMFRPGMGADLDASVGADLGADLDASLGADLDASLGADLDTGPDAGLPAWIPAWRRLGCWFGRFGSGDNVDNCADHATGY